MSVTLAVGATTTNAPYRARSIVLLSPQPKTKETTANPGTIETYGSTGRNRQSLVPALLEPMIVVQRPKLDGMVGD